MAGIVLILYEGYHEMKFIEDFDENHGSFYNGIIKKTEEGWLKQRRQDPQKVAITANAYAGLASLIIYLVDLDVNTANQKTEEAKEICWRRGVDFVDITTYPEFGTFCASCFHDFVINDRWGKTQIKQKALAFLRKKNPLVPEKEWTYTDIVSAGGTLDNARRFEKYFPILKHLKLGAHKDN